MKRTLAIAAAVLLVLSLFGLWGGYRYFLRRPNVRVTGDGIFYIHRGDTYGEVAGRLVEEGLVLDGFSFRKVAEAKRYPSLVKSGRYRLKEGMDNEELVNLLRSGEQEAVPFTFNNVRTLEQFAGIAASQLDIDSAAFAKRLKDRRTAESFGFSADNFMCMFLPDTYHIYWNTTAEGLLRRMAREYGRFWNPERKRKAAAAGLSPTEVSVLASIVEEETNRSDEYPLIAGVYINRLEKGWKLEACPTLKFAWQDFTLQRILDRHLEIDSPYNTYKYAGLPPGPVRMASPAAVDAVLDYSRHRYMFFCARSDFSGRHHFSRTLGEHNRHAAAYHRALDRKRIYR